MFTQPSSVWKVWSTAPLALPVMPPVLIQRLQISVVSVGFQTLRDASVQMASWRNVENVCLQQSVGVDFLMEATLRYMLLHSYIQY